MKKNPKSSKAAKKPAGTKSAAKKKPVAKAVPKKATGKTPPPGPQSRSVVAARYTPPPLQADGWRPFRYPPQ